MRENDIRDFWKQFHKYLTDNHIGFSFYENTGYGGIHWCKVNDQTPGFHGAPLIGVDLVNRNHLIRINIYIPNDRLFFEDLYSEKEKIEKTFGGELKWRECGKDASRIETYVHGLNYNNKSYYPELFKELADTIARFVTTFESKLLAY
jgi:hypothetical protein